MLADSVGAAAVANLKRPSAADIAATAEDATVRLTAAKKLKDRTLLQSAFTELARARAKANEARRTVGGDQTIQARIISILTGTSSGEHKQTEIGELLATYDRGFASGRKRAGYCDCGYPVLVLYTDGSSGPFMDMLDSHQTDETDPYTHTYSCPLGHASNQTITT